MVPKTLAFTLSLIAVGVFAIPGVTEACGAVDLVISKSGPATVTPGQTVEYRVELRQVADGVAINTYVYDDYPASLVPVSQQNVSGHLPFNCHPGIVCYLRKTFQGDVRVMKFIFQVKPDAVCGSTITNRVRTKSDEADQNSFTNQAQATSLVVCAATPTPTPTPTPQCQDGIDNDTDGAIDMNDFSCSSPTDNDETNPKAQCQDGIDNDGDGLIDFGSDPGCSSRQDNDEFNVQALSLACPAKAPWYDVNGDGSLTAADSQEVISALNKKITTAPGTGATWQNQANRLDVDGDGSASPIDAVLIINLTNVGQSGTLPRCATPTPTPTVTPAPTVIVNNINNNTNNNITNVTTGATNVTTGDVTVESKSKSETGDQTVNQKQSQHQTQTQKGNVHTVDVSKGKTAGASYGAAQTSPYPVGVPVTAKTGAGFGASLSTLVGAAGLALVQRRIR